MGLDGERVQAALLLAASAAWLGGLLTVPLLAATTRRLVAAEARADLFVAFGRRFAVLMGVLLTIALAAVGALAASGADPLTATALGLAAALLLMTAVGMVQARRMSRLRRAAAGGRGDEADSKLRRNAAVATVLRSSIGLVSLALVVVGVLLVGRG